MVGKVRFLFDGGENFAFTNRHVEIEHLYYRGYRGSCQRVVTKYENFDPALERL
jgi:hypothetical protein